MSNNLIQTKNLSKSYGSVTAISTVDFSLDKGEIRAIIGPNGAGKSTFVKTLYGEIAPDEGEIYLNGKSIKFNSPKKALASGIAMVPQDFGLIESMSIAENLAINNRTDAPIIFSTSAAYRHAQRVLQQLSTDIDPKILINKLSISEKQLISIAKALSVSSDLIIFDEPTSVLNANSFHLFKSLLKKLKLEGRAIIYVTHKLKEVLEIADSVSVFRESRLIFTSAVDKVTEDKLSAYFDFSSSISGASNLVNDPVPLLVVENLTTQNLDDISFVVSRGESIGIISDKPTESTELVKAIFGAVDKKSGTVKLGGHLLTTPSNCISNKVGFIPEDRLHEGIFDSLNILENISVLNFKKESRLGFFRKNSLIENAKDQIERLKIKCRSLYQSVINLSGGNQQKVLLAKWISFDFDLLLLLEPTAGIDLGGKSEIRSIILKLKSQGKSFLIASSDIQELESICDKILFIEHGKVNKLVSSGVYFNQ